MSKKNAFYLLASIAAGIIFIIYLAAIFQRGIWYGDHFLYKIQENEWEGDVYQSTLNLVKEISEKDSRIQLRFTHADECLYYNIDYDTTADNNETIKIYRDEQLIFTGCYMGDFLCDSSGTLQNDISITSSSNSDNDWYPTEAQIAEIALKNPEQFRGNLMMLLTVVIITALLLLDIKFPTLFFYLQHGLSVSHPEPSDFYYWGQKLGRIILFVFIIILMIMTFSMR